ncbi:MAG: hypothetical protein EKK52_17835 [Burkholderiales bacterium]|uniref:hypothetical protein n=1 Tax=Roseateles sp. TaxID=1971397 RepID=UPI000FAA818D|nr:MAG: hypothetical protein EKK52_17835 [Burkholderiales bacterium]
MTHHLSRQFRQPLDLAWLEDAGITLDQYRDELNLLSVCAAMHAVESHSLPASVEQAVARGFFDQLRELVSMAHERLSDVGELTDYYADAALRDAASPPAPGDFAVFDEAFGDRLLALGESTETRGHACIKLSLVTPRMLWDRVSQNTHMALTEARLLPHH